MKSIAAYPIFLIKNVLTSQNASAIASIVEKWGYTCKPVVIQNCIPFERIVELINSSIDIRV